MPEPLPASTSTVRRIRPGWAVVAVVAGLALAACGGDDEPAATTGTTAATTPSAALPPEARLTVELDPEQVGTEDNPRATRIGVDLQMEPASPDEAPPPVRAVELEIPPGVLFRPEELTACSAETLDADGPSGCPKGSRIGSGTVGARAGTIEVEGRATAVYGGDDRVLLWVAIANPVSVGAAISGRLEAQSAGGYRMALEVPAELQEVAGLPVALSRMRVSLGAGGALATTACPDGGLPFAARLDLGDATSEAAATAVCR